MSPDFLMDNIPSPDEVHRRHQLGDVASPQEISQLPQDVVPAHASRKPNQRWRHTKAQVQTFISGVATIPLTVLPADMNNPAAEIKQVDAGDIAASVAQHALGLTPEAYALHITREGAAKMTGTVVGEESGDTPEEQNAVYKPLLFDLISIDPRETNTMDYFKNALGNGITTVVLYEDLQEIDTQLGDVFVQVLDAITQNISDSSGIDISVLGKGMAVVRDEKADGDGGDYGVSVQSWLYLTQDTDFNGVTHRAGSMVIPDSQAPGGVVILDTEENEFPALYPVQPIDANGQRGTLQGVIITLSENGGSLLHTSRILAFDPDGKPGYVGFSTREQREMVLLFNTDGSSTLVPVDFLIDPSIDKFDLAKRVSQESVTPGSDTSRSTIEYDNLDNPTKMFIDGEEITLGQNLSLDWFRGIDPRYTNQPGAVFASEVVGGETGVGYLNEVIVGNYVKSGTETVSVEDENGVTQNVQMTYIDVAVLKNGHIYYVRSYMRAGGKISGSSNGRDSKKIPVEEAIVFLSPGDAILIGAFMQYPSAEAEIEAAREYWGDDWEPTQEFFDWRAIVDEGLGDATHAVDVINSGTPSDETLRFLPFQTMCFPSFPD